MLRLIVLLFLAFVVIYTLSPETLGLEPWAVTP